MDFIINSNSKLVINNNSYLANCEMDNQQW